MLLKLNIPQFTFLEKEKSRSGKYWIFFGHHYEKGHPCFVVGSSNLKTGEVVVRHYNDQIKDCVAPQAMATTYWEQFKSAMTQPSEHEGEYEDAEESKQLEAWFARADAGKRIIN
jgi:hypothetical protein